MISKKTKKKAVLDTLKYINKQQENKIKKLEEFVEFIQECNNDLRKDIDLYWNEEKSELFEEFYDLINNRQDDIEKVIFDYKAGLKNE